VIVANKKFPLSVVGFFLVCLLALSACTFVVGTTATTTQTCSGSPGARGATKTEASIANVVFKAINHDRASNGLAPLSWCPELANSARQHDLAMAKAGTLAHQLDGEAGLGERENEQGVSWSEAGENIGYDGSLSVNGALELHQLMMAEQPPDDGHRQNILSQDFDVVGVDILLDPRNGVLWLTEDFAQLAS
jgi:uncharacterized protein YkwD